ncbi:MAG: hypothetical protein IK095_06395 [Oscillospiraceae bacterium]|nr:hypothetical protein [Oscillospiraceae bacterium]
MNAKKIGGLILALALIIGGVVLTVKLLSGAFALVHGALDTILGIVLILALVAIVIWMFRFAKNAKK